MISDEVFATIGAVTLFALGVLLFGMNQSALECGLRSGWEIFGRLVLIAVGVLLMLATVLSCVG